MSKVTNTNIIIEQIQRNYTNRSIVKNIDTAFQYYKFPPRTTANAFEFEDFDIDFDLEDAGFDPVTGMHRIPEGSDSMVNLEAYDADRLEGQWEYLRKIPNRYKDNVSGGDANWNGGSLYDWKTIPFKATLDGNKLSDNGQGFVISPDIQKLCIENGKAIKFTCQLKLRADQTGMKNYDKSRGKTDQPSDAFFQNAEVQIRYKRVSPRGARRNLFLGPTKTPVYDDDVKPTATLQWDFYGAQLGDAAKGVMRDKHADYRPTIRLEYIVDPYEAQGYDIWTVEVVGKYNVFLNRPLSYWLIELIDDPGAGISNPNIRSRLYGKQVTNAKVDKLWASRDVRMKNTLYNSDITTRLDNAVEIKKRTTQYGIIKSINQNVKQSIASNLNKKAQQIAGFANIRWTVFYKLLQKQQLTGTVTTLNNYAALVWTAKNQPRQCINYILRGWEVYVKLDLDPPNPATVNFNAALLRQLLQKFTEAQRAFQDGTLPEQANLGTISGFYSQPVRTKVEGLLTKRYVGFQSGATKSPAGVWNQIATADKLLWAEAIRTFLVGIYDSVDPTEAQSNKTQQYWAGVINRNGGNNFKVNMKNFVTTGTNTAAFDSSFVDLIEQSDSSIRNQLYTIPDFGDGKNHSVSSGDGNFSFEIQGTKQLRPYQLGSFADPTWGADIYTGN